MESLNQIMLPHVEDVSIEINDLSVEAVMLQVQMLMTEDFGKQLSRIADKIELLSHVKKAYRENINKIHGFMAQGANTSRGDGRIYYESSAQQMSDIFSSCVKYNYDLEGLEFDPLTQKDYMTFAENEDYTDAGQMKEFFDKCADQVSNGEIADAIETAKDAGDDDGNLPYYFGHTNNKFEDGSPKFALFSASLDLIVEKINNFMSDIEEETEHLSIQLNQLTSQRQTALQGANDLIRKMEEITTNTVSKMG